MEKTLKITFLKAQIPLTKTFQHTAGGIEKTSYPNVYEVTSIEEEVTDMRELAKVLTKHAALGHCMVKGNLSRALVNESRAGTTDPNAVTKIICLDVDGSKAKTPDEFMKMIGMGDVSYTVQYSAGYKIVDNLLRCHIFIELEEEMVAPLLKQHLIALNFETPSLRADLSLTKTGNALRYTLDITTCQNDKLIYIADPKCIGFKPPVTKRIEYITKKRKKWRFKKDVSVMMNKELVEQQIATLREAANLPKRKNTYKLINNVETLIKPDQGIITGIKEERGFVYLNLNGGDSWAYYHPSNNPDLIHNFKGEPVYQTKELLPDYWQQICAQQKSNPVSTPTIGSTTFLAFLDKRSGAYWRGTYDSVQEILDIYVAKNETQVRHFAAQSGISLPSYIPEWDLKFDPHAPYRVDMDKQAVNLFQPTEYMKKKSKWSGKKSSGFPIITKVLHHALGSEQAITDYFINWLAYVAQKLDRTRTAWIFHGRTGTGKGLLMNNILAKLFGRNQTAVKRMEELAEPYNAYLERCFLVFVDEVQTSTLYNEKGVMAKIKNFITEPMISVRSMYQNAYHARNYANWIFASNMPDPVAVDMNDRRFNVGKYQTEPLVITQAEIDAIESELQAFFDYLMAYQVDESKASTPMDTEDRKNLMSISEASIDTAARALLDGDFEFFIDQLPTEAPTNMVMIDTVEVYKATLLKLMARVDPVDQGCNISRDELRALFDYVVGDMPKSPNKFTSRLKHHRIHTVRVRVNGLLTYGIATRFINVPADAEARITGKPKAVPSTKNVKPLKKKESTK